METVIHPPTKGGGVKETLIEFGRTFFAFPPPLLIREIGCGQNDVCDPQPLVRGWVLIRK